MRILIIGDINSPFVIEKIEWLKKTGEIKKIDVFSFQELKNENANKIGCKIVCPSQFINEKALLFFNDEIKNTIRFYSQIAALFELDDYYDIAQIHYVESAIANLLPIIKHKCKKIIVTIWGSDLLRSTEIQDPFRTRIYDECDLVTLIKNDWVLSKFKEKYPRYNQKEIRYVRLGGDIFNNLSELMNNISKIEAKKILNLDLSKIIVTIGYQADYNHKHIEILDLLLKNKTILKNINNIVFFLPLTYGATEQEKEKIINYYESKKVKFVYFRDYLSVNQVCMIRYASDVFINLLTTDTFSNSMREYMFTKNIVITGSWLPYNDLLNNGYYFRRIEKVDFIGDELEIVLENFNDEQNKCNVNDNSLLTYSDWSVFIKEWIKIYKEIL